MVLSQDYATKSINQSGGLLASGVCRVLRKASKLGVQTSVCQQAQGCNRVRTHPYSCVGIGARSGSRRILQPEAQIEVSKRGWRRASMNRPQKKAPGAGEQKLTRAETADLVNHERIETESQVRALAGIAAEQHAEVFERASRSGRPTARRIAEEAGKEGPVIDLDETGYPVPERALKYWKMREEMQELLGLISAARSAIRKENQEDRIFVEIRLQE